MGTSTDFRSWYLLLFAFLEMLSNKPSIGSKFTSNYDQEIYSSEKTKNNTYRGLQANSWQCSFMSLPFLLFYWEKFLYQIFSSVVFSLSFQLLITEIRNGFTFTVTPYTENSCYKQPSNFICRENKKNWFGTTHSASFSFVFFCCSVCSSSEFVNMSFFLSLYCCAMHNVEFSECSF